MPKTAEENAEEPLFDVSNGMKQLSLKAAPSFVLVSSSSTRGTSASTSTSTTATSSTSTTHTPHHHCHSPQRLDLGAPPSPLKTTYPLSRGPVHGGPSACEKKSKVLHPSGSPSSLESSSPLLLSSSCNSSSSSSSPSSSWSHNARSFRFEWKPAPTQKNNQHPRTPSPVKKPSASPTAVVRTTTPTTARSRSDSSTLSSSMLSLSTPIPLQHEKTLRGATIVRPDDVTDVVEVVLGLTSPPRSSSSSPRKKNLLDLHEQQHVANFTPSPDRSMVQREPSTLINLCGITIQDWCHSDGGHEYNHCANAIGSACGEEGDDASHAHPQEEVQGRICVSLGMDGWCQPWQASYPVTESPRRMVRNTSSNSTYSNKNEEGPMMKRQAFRKRRSHLASLRRDLNPFYAAEDRPRQLGKVHSFQHHQRSSPPPPPVVDGPKKKDPQRNSRISSVWECGGGCVAVNNSSQGRQHESPAAIRLQWEEACQGYDSDPEDYPQRHHHSKENKSHHRSSPNNPLLLQATTLHEFLNDRSTLILHDAGKSVAMHVWIERGQRLANTIILPKLAWRPCNTSDIYQAPSGMDLLDICRIRCLDNSSNHNNASTMLFDRKLYPFARTDRLLEIKAVNGPAIALEARSAEDRDRWVTLAKLAVSTFAAQLLTHDPTALSMFFAEEQHACVPGEEPWVLSNLRSKSPPPPASEHDAWI